MPYCVCWGRRGQTYEGVSGEETIFCLFSGVGDLERDNNGHSHDLIVCFWVDIIRYRFFFAH